jgi:putative membrane protein
MMYGNNYYPYMANGYGHHFFGLGILAMIIFWIIVVLIIVAIVRWATGHGREHWHGKERDESSALRILKERYAKGEINKEEFETKKKDLTQ